MQNKQPDVLLISETWLTPFSPKLDIPGYDLYRQDRVHKKGGGVVILVSSKLHCTDRPDLASKLEESKCMTIEIKLKNSDCCLVSSMYRPPNIDTSTFLASYNSLICAMKKEKPKGITVGLDHNLDFLKADKHQATNDFVQNNLDFGLIPTIDNIIVSQNLCGAYTSSILINGMSDHLPTFCVLNSLISAKKEPIVIK